MTDALVDTAFIAALAFAWQERPDSLLLIGSRGFWTYTEIEGAWRGDTLVGRIHVSHDYGYGRDEPRANIFGRLYACTDKARAQEAEDFVERLAMHDSPDRGRDSLERAEREDRIRAWLRREGLE